MKKYKWLLIINLIVVLGLFHRSLSQKETMLAHGQLVLLKLAPVDPRSLLQGDYMRLNYEITDNNFFDEKIPPKGYCIIKLNEKGIAEKIRIQPNQTPLNKGEYLLKYTANKYNDMHIGAESYFFQEGEGKKFEKAIYGGIKIDSNGNTLLTGLYNKNLKKIE